MSKWIAEFDLEDGDTMPKHMDLNYMRAKIDFHCRPMWIPVSERMPEEDCRNGENQQKSDYLLMSVYSEEDGVTIVDYGYTVDGNWYSDTTYQFIPPGWEVIAWMPLPEPYKPHESE